MDDVFLVQGDEGAEGRGGVGFDVEQAFVEEFGIGGVRGALVGEEEVVEVGVEGDKGELGRWFGLVRWLGWGSHSGLTVCPVIQRQDMQMRIETRGSAEGRDATGLETGFKDERKGCLIRKG